MAFQAGDQSSSVAPGKRPAQQQQQLLQLQKGISTISPRSPQSDRPSVEQLPPRRSSTISLDSFKESTNDMWLPRPKPPHRSDSDSTTDDASWWASAALAFALLPAIGGMVFTNGSAVISDILLLGLAAIFLNWSVRLPWTWYRSAQELCTQDAALQTSFSSGDISDSSPDSPLHSSPDGSPTFKVPIANETQDGASTKPTPARRSARKLRQITSYEASRKELYRHELLALTCCFIFPVAGAYLLHNLRNSLSRPSEGLVSNFNLTIFLLAAELRPISHLLKLVQARTLHLQRIVKDNPNQSVDEQQTKDISQIRERIDEMESRIAAPLQTPLAGSTGRVGQMDEKDIAIVGAGVRKQFQPELDALNRAVRRYEKRAALQAMQTESRLLDLEARLGDAISLAAAASRSSQAKGTVATMIEWGGAAVLLPWQVARWVARISFGFMKGVLGMPGLGGRKVNPGAGGRDWRMQVDVGRRKSNLRGGREAERVLKAQASTVR